MPAAGCLVPRRSCGRRWRSRRRGVGNEFVALVRRRVGLEVVLVGCGVDDEVLDELRKYAQVSLSDEWVYV